MAHGTSPTLPGVAAAVVQISLEQRMKKEPDAQHAQGKDPAKTDAAAKDADTPRTGSPPEQVKVWEEEGGSPPEQISSTKSVKPKQASRTGSMGPAKD